MPEDRAALAKWVAHRDEAAFTELVSGHAALVANACRRHLGDSDEADEATQAVFILLAKHAAQLRDPGRLSSWLYSTARRVCCRYRRSLARRKRHEREAAMRMQRVQDTSDLDPIWNEARTHLDDAIADLSSAQRDAIVGCYLEGREQADVATRLGVSEDAVRRRLHYSLEKLRSWFARRGVAIPLSVLVIGISGEAAAAPPALVSACIQSAINPAAAPSAAALAGKATTAMLIHKTVIFATLILTLGGGGILVQSTMAAERSPAPIVPAKVAHDAPASTDWPQFKGPAGTGVVEKSPKLLDVWPQSGPRQVWTSDELPFAPLCGTGSPVVAGGKVFTYAQVELPQKGIKPFTPEFLALWGWADGVPDDLWKKVDAAQDINPKFHEATNKGPAALDAYAKEFLATIDPAQAKKFGPAFRRLFGLDGAPKGANWQSSDDLKWMASMKDKEIPTRGEFVDLFVRRYGGRLYHSSRDETVKAQGDKMYKPNMKYGDSLICLDAATGKELWRKVLPGAFKEWGTGFGCSSIPAVAKDKVYFAGSGAVYCLDIKKKGDLVWQGKAEPTHSSPVIGDGVVYFCAGELAAYNADSGQELWRQPKVKSDMASAVLWKNNGRTSVLCATPGAATCVDPASGAVQWQEHAGGNYSSLAVSGDIMVLRSNDGTIAYRISAQKAEKIWASADGSDYGGSPLIYQDHVYMCGKAYAPDLLTVFDLKTGAITLKQVGKGGECSTGLVVDGKIIFECETNYKLGRLIMFKATPDKYEEVGQLPNQDLASCTSPAFADGKVFVRMPTAIACYDLTAR